MNSWKYSVAPKDWATTPVVLGTNPMTGHRLGACKNYRDQQTLEHNSSELVIPNIELRLAYDGTNEFGEKDDSMVLPGGLADGIGVLRRTAALGLEVANDAIIEISGRVMSLGGLDLLRTYVRQEAGFLEMLLAEAKTRGKKLDAMNATEFTLATIIADGTFSYVNPDKDSQAFKALWTKLKKDKRFMSEIAGAAEAQKKAGQAVTDTMIDRMLWEYIAGSCNSRIGRAAGLDIPLNYDGNAHAGAGAADVFVYENGIPLNLSYFDCQGEIAAADFTEIQEDIGIAHVRKRMGTDQKLATYMAKRGYPTPESFDLAAWQKCRLANRLRYHALHAVGATFYTAEDPKEGGEDWHWELSDIVYDPFTGAVLHYEELTAATYPDSGNSSHTLERLGPNAIAVWGGKSGHEQARAQFGLELE